ncbi:cyclin dependent kinase inhibitor 1Ca [Lampris incognitus]|uniref:cyclin dependent kinase inhibitor 1Ca n=1 Tax=Lampris incognitus TaxID=2546036 RepID=UPI0024B5D1BF|nr:cyclin dependent kinase inhibitor 1Ca [Lampris incognitus]
MLRKSEGSLTTRREAASHHGRGARRSLFGPVDHDELNRELKLRLNEMAEQDTRRWNFHFETETPLPGIYQWEEIPSRRAASLYREPTRAGAGAEDGRTPGDRRCPRSAGDEADQENCPGVFNAADVPAEGTPVRRKRVLPKHASNYKITDFFVKRRKVSEAKNIPSHFHPNCSQQALCMRIRRA